MIVDSPPAVCTRIRIVGNMHGIPQAKALNIGHTAFIILQHRSIDSGISSGLRRHIFFSSSSSSFFDNGDGFLLRSSTTIYQSLGL